MLRRMFLSNTVGAISIPLIFNIDLSSKFINGCQAFLKAIENGKIENKHICLDETIVWNKKWKIENCIIEIKEKGSIWLTTDASGYINNCKILVYGNGEWMNYLRVESRTSAFRNICVISNCDIVNKW